MKDKVLKTIQKYNLIKEGDKIVIGVSGGPDSMCLLSILNQLKDELKFELIVAHVNHMIRQEADEETRYVQEYCNKINVECYIKKVNVLEKSSTERIGTEEAGRKARYEFFEEVLRNTGFNKVATAHNANDNAETLLMNIFRGTGISGLKGIEPIRGDKFIRPLIECERFEIETYCEQEQLNPKIDKSNFENIYTRNKIRNVLIPQIKKEFNPNIIDSLNKLSSLAKQEDEFIQNYIDELIEELIINDDKNMELNNQDSNVQNELILDLKKFNQKSDFIKSKVIMKSIQKVLGTTQGIEKIHVDDIITLCAKNIGNKYLTPNKHVKVLVKQGKIFFVKL